MQLRRLTETKSPRRLIRCNRGKPRIYSADSALGVVIVGGERLCISASDPSLKGNEISARLCIDFTADETARIASQLFGVKDAKAAFDALRELVHGDGSAASLQRALDLANAAGIPHR